MGLSLEFLIGPPKEMLDALTECDYAELDRLTEKKADFSFHLQPRDLQMLSDCAASYAGRPLKPFRSALTCYFDEADRGYFLVHDDWVDAMATIDAKEHKMIAAKWFEKMAKNYPNEQIGKPSEAAENAVRALIELCKHAVQFEKPVIHIWSA